jgi:hypothetical protein
MKWLLVDVDWLIVCYRNEFSHAVMLTPFHCLGGGNNCKPNQLECGAWLAGVPEALPMRQRLVPGWPPSRPSW